MILEQAGVFSQLTVQDEAVGVVSPSLQGAVLPVDGGGGRDCAATVEHSGTGAANYIVL